MATRSVSRTPPPCGVGEVPQVEQAIVDEAVIAADELHEAGDGAVVDDAGVVAEEERTASDRASDSAVPDRFSPAVRQPDAPTIPIWVAGEGGGPRTRKCRGTQAQCRPQAAQAKIALSAYSSGFCPQSGRLRERSRHTERR